MVIPHCPSPSCQVKDIASSETYMCYICLWLHVTFWEVLDIMFIEFVTKLLTIESTPFVDCRAL